jgi:hypothetical protein
VADPKKKPPSRTVQVCTLVFLVIAIAVSQVVGLQLFPQPAGGFSIAQVAFAAVLGGAGGLIGAMVGMGIDALLKKK